MQTEQEALQLVKEATSPQRTRNVVGIFDELSDCLCKVADLVSKDCCLITEMKLLHCNFLQAECIRMLHLDPDFVSEAERAHAAIHGLVEE